MGGEANFYSWLFQFPKARNHHSKAAFTARRICPGTLAWVWCGHCALPGGTFCCHGHPSFGDGADRSTRGIREQIVLFLPVLNMYSGLKTCVSTSVSVSVGRRGLQWLHASDHGPVMTKIAHCPGQIQLYHLDFFPPASILPNVFLVKA